MGELASKQLPVICTLEIAAAQPITDLCSPLLAETHARLPLAAAHRVLACRRSGAEGRGQVCSQGGESGRTVSKQRRSWTGSTGHAGFRPRMSSNVPLADTDSSGNAGAPVSKLLMMMSTTAPGLTK